MKNPFSILLLLISFQLFAIDHTGIASNDLKPGYFPMIQNGVPVKILIDENDDSAVKIAVGNLQKDFESVSGRQAEVMFLPQAKRLIIIGSVGSKYIKALIRNGKIDEKELKGKNEKYVMSVIANPMDGVEEALVIVGSDRRGTVYGTYELSEQIGVSPWYDWADVPVIKHQNLSIKPGKYTAGEPAVKYRGIFLNDEAPCLTTWVYNTYGTKYGDHRFYSKVFELMLRLRANYLWPAMWNWSFYADDGKNSETANQMGIIIGTSHHEPMARNHQEWVRKRKEYGEWDYRSNQKNIDQFFREGIQRAAKTEDLITIGMRGDGDTPMGGKEGEDHKTVPNDEENIKLLNKIIRNQRKIIKDVTGKPANKTPQMWALYKEVQKYYDKGLTPPHDVIILLSDDNWGNLRRLPRGKEKNHPGGWGMYYHVDYVGAPRNSKTINVSPIQNIWEQTQLAYDYGVDKIWIVNVGDLKPMEYPISLFMNMAWNPKKYTTDNLLLHTRDFCAQQFGDRQANEAARILNLYSKYNGRVTPEMLDAETYNLESGEWKQVSDEYLKLEAEALRQYVSLSPEYKDAYKQLILYPVQMMANLYEMYYSQAMNHKLYKKNNPEANFWADKVETTFQRDADLSYDYNHVMSGGKWNGMMIQKKIGYTSWNDNFPKDTLPKIYRINSDKNAGGYVFTAKNNVVVMEAEHYFETKNSPLTSWTTIPYMGRTLSGVALMPYNKEVSNASLSYKMSIPKDIDKVKVHVVVKSTLAFHDPEGHRYSVGFTGKEEKIINFNKNLNEEPANIYSVFYPTVARRVVENETELQLPETADGQQTLIIKPLDPGIVFEKIIIDFGGYEKTYLFMNESPFRKMP
ncbi:glycosyl hydrolase 115 family protein [uncultured Chryseobacterium sp.]|uniref:glycosyl hydrolase 115 family protein n=1 Tax=uncultured Chryseobacterium sp. TaxID=259322 RepID=UPI0025E93A50|nr:glycosyl hydrolase 115 family protein [uncultured Chryseobacterium sp.]